jgi:hypothetical protein
MFRIFTSLEKYLSEEHAQSKLIGRSTGEVARLFGNCRDGRHLSASQAPPVVAEALPSPTSGSEQAFATAIPNEPVALFCIAIIPHSRAA